MRRIDQHLAGILEVHRDPVADGGLNLTEPPVRLKGVAHIHAGQEMLCHISNLPVAAKGISCLADSILLCRTLLFPTR